MVYPAGPARAGGWAEYLCLCAGPADVGGSAGLDELLHRCSKTSTAFGAQPLGGRTYDAHHIAMSNSSDVRMVKLRQKMSDLDIDINNSKNGIWLPNSRADRIEETFTQAYKGSGVHSNSYKQYNHDKSINSEIDKEILLSLEEMKNDFFAGRLFPLASVKVPIL